MKVDPHETCYTALNQKKTSEREDLHNKHAPFWAGGILLFGTLGVSTTFLDFGDFWRGYVLDMTGPAWNYILFRLRFTEYVDNKWTRTFTPTRTLVIFLIVVFGIEGAQYLNMYDSTFDPLDLLAYISILIPIYLVDLKTR